MRYAETIIPPLAFEVRLKKVQDWLSTTENDLYAIDIRGYNSVFFTFYNKDSTNDLQFSVYASLNNNNNIIPSPVDNSWFALSTSDGLITGKASTLAHTKVVTLSLVGPERWSWLFIRGNISAAGNPTLVMQGKCSRL